MIGTAFLDSLQQMFGYQFMVNAFVVGSVVSVVAGIIGYFVVLRASSFAAHALSHIGFAGATGAVVLGASPLAGLLVFTVGAGLAIGSLGARMRGRDVTIGIVLAWALGLGVLFLSLYRGYATEAYALLFGEILGLSVRDVYVTFLFAAGALAALAVIYRPLLFSSVDEVLARARGVPVTFLSAAFMVILAVAVSEAVQAVGVLLIFALIVTPAATAIQLSVRPHRAIALSALLAFAYTDAGLVVSFYSPHPVSFFITTFAFAGYLVVRLAKSAGTRARGPRAASL